MMKNTDGQPEMGAPHRRGAENQKNPTAASTSHAGNDGEPVVVVASAVPQHNDGEIPTSFVEETTAITDKNNNNDDRNTAGRNFRNQKQPQHNDDDDDDDAIHRWRKQNLGNNVTVKIHPSIVIPDRLPAFFKAQNHDDLEPPQGFRRLEFSENDADGERLVISVPYGSLRFLIFFTIIWTFACYLLFRLLELGYFWLLLPQNWIAIFLIALTVERLVNETIIKVTLDRSQAQKGRNGGWIPNGDENRLDIYGTDCIGIIDVETHPLKLWNTKKILIPRSFSEICCERKISYDSEGDPVIKYQVHLVQQQCGSAQVKRIPFMKNLNDVKHALYIQQQVEEFLLRGSAPAEKIPEAEAEIEM